jgi:hypothetical protein
LDLVSGSGFETDTLLWNECLNQTQVGYWKMNKTAHVPDFSTGWLREALKFVE